MVGPAEAQNAVMKFIDYERHEVEIRDWDPTALEVFAFLRDSAAAALPGHGVEHIGSTSVPGLRGKGIGDVMVLANDDADVAIIAERLVGLGLAHARGSRPERPFLLGGVDHEGATTYVHIHVIRAGSDEAIAQHGLAQALREDPSLRDEYAAFKRRVVESGTTDATDYSVEKGDWVVNTLDRLGLPPLPDPGPPPPKTPQHA
jgi:GrpB-like predicted nucleotidyltransferase (UPF0157 family)